MLVAAVVLVAGCVNKIDLINRVDSGTKGVYVTVETSYGPSIAPDVTWVYAHLVRGGKSDRKLILYGDYLQDTQVAWQSDSELTLCIPGGYTTTFKNWVTLNAGASDLSIHTHLRDNCSGPPYAPGVTP